MLLVYFSSVAENTHRFVEKVGAPTLRIPIAAAAPPVTAAEPYILVTPTYGNADVPKQVVRFLNDPANRELLRGVVGSGNINFGDDYARAADVISARTGVPVIHKFELLGTSEDVQIVRYHLEHVNANRR